MFKRVKQSIPWELVDAYKERLQKLQGKAYDPVELMEAAAQALNFPLPDPLKAVIRLDEYYRPKAEKPEDPTARKRPRKKPSLMGKNFEEYCNSLDIAELLLLACGHDYFKAREIYRTVDFEDAMGLVNSYLVSYAKDKLYHFETVLYGMGGHYDEDKVGKGEVNHIDLTSNSEASREQARARLRALGMAGNG